MNPTSRLNPTLHQVLVSPLIGGAGIVAIRLAGAARTHGTDCVAWVPGRGPASDALDRAEVTWRTYSLAAIGGDALHQLKECLRIASGMSSFKRPIVHVHNPVVYRYLWPALRAARARVVVHFHIEPSPDEVHYAMRYPPDHVITCARYIAESINHVLQRPGRPPVVVTAIANAIDLDRFGPGQKEIARQKVDIRTNQFVVLMLANLAPHKGQQTVLRAVHLLAKRGLVVECWLAGEDRSTDKAYESKLRSMVSELGLQNAVRFLGFRADTPDLLRAADAFVLPSTHEGLPLSILEAQASGLPVIASNIPGVREVVSDSRTGFIVEAENHAGYADRMERLVQDSDLCRRIAEAAAANVSSEYGWPQFEKRVFAIYESLR